MEFASHGSPAGEPTDWPVDGYVALFKEITDNVTKKKKIMGEEEYRCRLLDIIRRVCYDDTKYFYR
jgi:hypothetical protein